MAPVRHKVFGAADLELMCFEPCEMKLNRDISRQRHLDLKRRDYAFSRNSAHLPKAPHSMKKQKHCSKRSALRGLMVKDVLLCGAELPSVLVDKRRRRNPSAANLPAKFRANEIQGQWRRKPRVARMVGMPWDCPALDLPTRDQTVFTADWAWDCDSDYDYFCDYAADYANNFDHFLIDAKDERAENRQRHLDKKRTARLQARFAKETSKNTARIDFVKTHRLRRRATRGWIANNLIASGADMPAVVNQGRRNRRNPSAAKAKFPANETYLHGSGRKPRVARMVERPLDWTDLDVPNYRYYDPEWDNWYGQKELVLVLTGGARVCTMRWGSMDCDLKNLHLAVNLKAPLETEDVLVLEIFNRRGCSKIAVDPLGQAMFPINSEWEFFRGIVDLVGKGTGDKNPQLTFELQVQPAVAEKVEPAPVEPVAPVPVEPKGPELPASEATTLKMIAEVVSPLRRDGRPVPDSAEAKVALPGSFQVGKNEGQVTLSEADGEVEQDSQLPNTQIDNLQKEADACQTMAEIGDAYAQTSVFDRGVVRHLASSDAVSPELCAQQREDVKQHNSQQPSAADEGVNACGRVSESHPSDNACADPLTLLSKQMMESALIATKDAQRSAEKLKKWAEQEAQEIKRCAEQEASAVRLRMEIEAKVLKARAEQHANAVKTREEEEKALKEAQGLKEEEAARLAKEREERCAMMAVKHLEKQRSRQYTKQCEQERLQAEKREREAEALKAKDLEECKRLRRQVADDAAKIEHEAKVEAARLRTKARKNADMKVRAALAKAEAEARMIVEKAQKKTELMNSSEATDAAPSTARTELAEISASSRSDVSHLEDENELSRADSFEVVDPCSLSNADWRTWTSEDVDLNDAEDVEWEVLSSNLPRSVADAAADWDIED